MAKASAKAITATRKASPDRSTKAKSTPTHEQIAERAYERWRANGGDAESNWLAAEAELNGTAKRSGTSSTGTRRS